jgi:hypothetical protein
MREEGRTPECYALVINFVQRNTTSNRSCLREINEKSTRRRAHFMTGQCPGNGVSRRSVLLSVAGVIIGSAVLGVDTEVADAVSTRVPRWAHRWQYLRLLHKHHVQATFNMIGEQVRPNRHLVRAVASEGHVIANHTWTHDEALPSGTPEHIHREIQHTNEAIHDVTGHTPTQFRAPGGVWGPRVYDELARQHMMPVGWDIDPRDWAMPGVAAIESAMLQAGRGDIILCHDGGGDRSETYQALKKVIPELLHRGLTFVTLPSR